MIIIITTIVITIMIIIWSHLPREAHQHCYSRGPCNHHYLIIARYPMNTPGLRRANLSSTPCPRMKALSKDQTNDFCMSVTSLQQDITVHPLFFSTKELEIPVFVSFLLTRVLRSWPLWLKLDFSAESKACSLKTISNISAMFPTVSHRGEAGLW